MTQPPDPGLPAYGSPPPPARTVSTVDQVLSWLLWILHVLGAIALGFVSLFSIFLTDSCGTSTSSTVPAVCDSGYFGSVLIGYWIALVAIPVLTLVGMIVATARSRMAWPWSVGGFVLTTIATILFFALVFR